MTVVQDGVTDDSEQGWCPPDLFGEAGAKCFHFYTLTGSQVLSGCQLLRTNFSPLHIKVLLVYPHVFLFFSSLPQIQVLFPNLRKWAVKSE